MNNHLLVVCALPTVLFVGGGLLLFMHIKFTIPDDTFLRDVGGMFMIGGIIIALQSLYSIYF